MKRRDFVKSIGMGAASLSLPQLYTGCTQRPTRPNIIYILADDLGYAELGSYGQSQIRTPHLDRMADEGMKFSQHYAGSPVCAPSRCTLLTGLHTGHSYIRENDEMRERGDVWNNPEIEGQRPLPTGTMTLGTLMQEAGYTTAAIGKWGLGGPTDSGHPNDQGFDYWYGYLCQRQAHNYYPTHLWRNREKHVLEGNTFFKAHQRFPQDQDPSERSAYAQYSSKHYAPDLMTQEALRFIHKNQDTPFFLYLAYPMPHLALQVPEDSLEEYADEFSESPYLGDRGYLPHPTPRAAYAAMITRMDRDIGRIFALLVELGLDENTLVMFSSDNGPTYTGGADTSFFKSAGPLRGLKGSVYEGGIRVPLIARWPGQIRAGSTSTHVSAFWDVMPTLCDIAGRDSPRNTDGTSFSATLLGKPQPQPNYLYWEFLGYGGQQAVRMGNWKAVRTGLR
ncbi:MAG: sulfatase-like hydrolase/transferase, partial [Candidatus Aminicenantes bacterium]|nr:sulfatase-like hydrolase/transferase [Candidatus Aminicenantes bacterium]